LPLAWLALSAAPTLLAARDALIGAPTRGRWTRQWTTTSAAHSADGAPLDHGMRGVDAARTRPKEPPC
jgi:hypothetical protein